MNLDQHLDHSLHLSTANAVRRAVAVLLDANTCFAVIGGENTIRLHWRGIHALVDAGVIR